ncbi:MAG: hypothetical protein KC636_03235, partial [Myxococcales bacterium]|nr:hypothetical protein [Myxococcales bacterium]
MTRRRCRDRARWTCAGLGLLAMACGGEEPSTTGLSGGTGGETSTATATDSEGETDPSTTAGSSSGSDTSDTDP